jgi:hypothetical protein
MRGEMQTNAVALREEIQTNAVALRGEIEKNAQALHAMLEKEAGFLRDELSLKLAVFAIKIECLNDNILDLRSQQRAILRLISKWEEKTS